jgi:cyanophycin synthetase
VVGVEVAGLDLIVEDIGRPLEEQGGVVLEVNAHPCISLHFTPFCDRPRPICEAILDLLFPDGQCGRIPVVVVATGGGQSLTGRLLEALLKKGRRRIGRTSAAGLYINGRRIKAGDCANAAGARSLFLCPDAELAILQQSCAGIRAEGLAVDRCELTILEDVCGAPGSRESSEWGRAASVLIESLSPQGTLVIDAGQFESFPSAAALSGKRIILTSAARPAGLKAMDSHWVYRRGGEIVLGSARLGEQLLPLPPGWLRDEPWPAELGRAVLHAVAGAWALAVPLDELATGLAALAEDLAE